MLLTKNKTIRTLAGAVETFNLLFLKLLLKNPEAARGFPSKVFTDYMSLVGTDKWSCKEIFEIFPAAEEIRVTIAHLPGKGIQTPIADLVNLALITRLIKPRRIFEIGTFRGRTALNFALNAENGCRIHTLDIPPEERAEFLDSTNLPDQRIITMSETGADYKGRAPEGMIEQLYGNSLEFDFSPYFGEIDLVFVDGAHHFEAVKSDTENALKMVKAGGYIVWDDFAVYGDYNDVTRAVLEALPGEQVIQIAGTHMALYRQPDTSSS